MEIIEIKDNKVNLSNEAGFLPVGTLDEFGLKMGTPLLEKVKVIHRFLARNKKGA